MVRIPLAAYLPVVVLCVVAASSPVVAQADSNWPGWRGPLQTGHSLETGFPHEWNDSNVLWSSDLPGDGQSSPVIWGDRIFLTTALDGGRERVILCADRRSGKILWQKSLWKGEPEPTHKMNGWASATCATDGERVYAFFGKGGGLFCLSVDGDLVWNRNLGDFPSPWGTAACPVLVDDLVIQNCDSEGDSFLLAVDAKTGKDAWRTPRESLRGWSTPVLIETSGRREIVLQGETGVRAYDPKSGKQLWQTTGSKGRGTPTVTPANGLLYVVPGRPGETVALQPGGSGDVTASHKKWGVQRKGRDLPSPIVIGDFVLIMSQKGGILTCYDAQTGEQYWQERIGGNHSASPVAFDGLAAFIAEEGEALIIRPGKQLDIVSRNTLTAGDDEIFRASITPSAGQLFLRSTKKLYCVGRK
ncbi:PQQ-binding-like beta-propeller repeat protein [bacterium]|nr:PQQ-binding-like beta-propeller repeat protein [bacterium]